mmetsp:Transcript_25074/g.41776  ORF Transcript_25074/g.41776 Transcript_25074/m.41776 type:complete len:135 (+) Transcript_25074:95-499(+)
MASYIGLISLLVRDYDEAISYYTEKLGFVLAEDKVMTPEKRWVVVHPPGSGSLGTTRILLAKATNPEEISSIGNQCGGRVFLFLNTDNFARDYEAMRSKQVEFLETPRYEEYGTVAVFKDLYGNKYDLIEFKES